MNRKRLLTVFMVLGVVVLACAGIWVAGSRIQAPAEAAARIAPPTSSPILVPVEQRGPAPNIVTRGTASFGLPQSISLVPSPLKTEVGVISTLPARNTQVQEGDVLLTASGRPVFVLQGMIPAFRDLATGVSGEDVRQLESSLERLGFDPGPVDGIYDEQTGMAVADWYASAGFELIGPTDDQLATIRALEDELAVVQNDQLAAEDAAAAAPLVVEAARVRAAYELARANSSAKPSVQLAGEVAIQAAINAQKAAERENQRLGDLADRLLAGLAKGSRPGPFQVSVEGVASPPGTDGVDGFHIYFEVLADETPVALEGFSLRLTIPVESTGGKVTVVPVSALSLAADGTTRVQVEKDGVLEFVTVEPGLSADGFAAVGPVDGALTAGQLVGI